VPDDFARYLRPKQAARYTGMSESNLAKRRMRGDPPAFIKLAHNQVAYDRIVLDDVMRQCRRSSTSDTGTSEAA
jgi:predicted DNA-binding transcriptional regulator AlpA